jgi:hypothetical protein
MIKIKKGEKIMSKEKRFEIVQTEGNGLTSPNLRVIVDTETGVNYLFMHDGYAGGLTVMLDAEGKPIITK